MNSVTQSDVRAMVAKWFPGAPLRQPEIRATPTADRCGLFADRTFRPALTVDIETGAVDTVWCRKSDNSTTFRRAYGRTLLLDLPAIADGTEVPAWLDTVSPLLAVLLGGAEDMGPDRRPKRSDASWTAEAILASLMVPAAGSNADIVNAAWQQIDPAPWRADQALFLEAWNAIPSCPIVESADFAVGYWEAGDWIQETPEGLTAATTDAELGDIAQGLVDDARRDDVLIDMDAAVSVLETLRDRMQEEQEEKDGAE